MQIKIVFDINRMNQLGQWKWGTDCSDIEDMYTAHGVNIWWKIHNTLKVEIFFDGDRVFHNSLFSNWHFMEICYSITTI